MNHYRKNLFAVLVLAAAATGAGHAAETRTADSEALRQQLSQAHEQLDAAAARVAELSRQLGDEESKRTTRRVMRIGQRPMLGLVLGTSGDRGVRLQAVTPDGPAAKAGLESGDVVIAIDGQAVAGADQHERLNDARQRLSGLADGQQVQLDFERDGHPGRADVSASPVVPSVFISGIDADAIGIDLKALDIDIDKIRADVAHSLDQVDLGKLAMIAPMLSESLRFDAWRWQRLRLAELDDDLGRYFGTRDGVLVLKPEGDPATGLRSGDVILAVAGEPVSAPGQVMRKLADAEPGTSIKLTVMRDRSRQDLQLTAPDRPSLLEPLGTLPVPPTPPTPPSVPEARSWSPSPPSSADQSVIL